MNGSSSDGRPFFEVAVSKFEPPVVRAGSKGRNLQKKRELQRAIEGAVKPGELSEAVKAGKGTLVSVAVEFRLWRGSAETTATRPVKDLDNLLKAVLDVLKQPDKSGGIGLGVIDGDHYVCDVTAHKTLVDTTDEEGFSLSVSKFADDKMLDVLTAYDRLGKGR